MIPGEEEEWFCPNCGKEGSALMWNLRRFVWCQPCESYFEIVTYGNNYKWGRKAGLGERKER